MPSEQELAIILRFRDLATSQLATAVGNAGEQLNKLGQNMKVLGREISQVGSSMMMLGTAIAGPLLLAFKQAEKYSLAVSQEIERLTNITRQLQTSIAEALAPIIHNLTNFLGKLLSAWNSLTPAQQQAIVQTVFMSGMYLIMTGTVVRLIGTITRLIGIMIKWASTMVLFATVHPILAAISIAVIAIVLAMIKWEGVAKVVLNTLEVGFKVLYGAIKLVEAALWKVAQAATWMLPGVSVAFKKMADTAYAEAQKAAEGIGKVFKEGTGRWTEGFEEFKQEIAELFNMFQNPPEFNTKPMEAFLQSFNNTFINAYKQAVNLGQQSANILNSQIDSVSMHFGNALGKMAIEGGKFKDLMIQAFREMAADFIAQVTAMIAKWMAFKAIKAVGKFFGLFHEGGMIMHSGGLVEGLVKAHSGLAVDEIPIIAQRGEGILSRRGMTALGGPNVLNVLNRGYSLPQIVNNQIINNHINIDISNPVIREESDIDKLTEEISYRLSKETERYG